MLDIIGIDSRAFKRSNPTDSLKTFESVLGIAVRVTNYYNFKEEYEKALTEIFKEFGIEKEYSIYCYNDLKDIPQCWQIIEELINKISESIHKVHVFYSMFSSKRIQAVKVYGRMAKKQKIKLSTPTRTYKEFVIKHLTSVFPIICAWRIMKKFGSKPLQFHLDAFGGHTCEAYEELQKSHHKSVIYTSGDCLNCVISIADLLIALLDKRLEENKKPLIFENIRPSLKELGEKILAFPISNIHLPKITPLEKKPIIIEDSLLRPMFWVFKGDDLMDSGVLKRSKTYRNLLDVVSFKGGCVKLFTKKDAEHIKKGDYGIFFDSNGERIIDNYSKIGKKLIKHKLDLYVKTE